MTDRYELPFAEAFDEVEYIDGVGAPRVMLEPSKVLYVHRTEMLQAANQDGHNYVPLLYAVSALVCRMYDVLQHALPVQNVANADTPSLGETIITRRAPLRNALFVAPQTPNGVVALRYAAEVAVATNIDGVVHIYDKIVLVSVWPGEGRWDHMTDGGQWNSCWDALLKAASYMVPQMVEITHRYGGWRTRSCS